MISYTVLWGFFPKSSIQEYTVENYHHGFAATVNSVPPIILYISTFKAVICGKLLKFDNNSLLTKIMIENKKIIKNKINILKCTKKHKKE